MAFTPLKLHSPSKACCAVLKKKTLEGVKGEKEEKLDGIAWQ